MLESKTSEADLIGYVRLDKANEILRVNIHRDAFNKAKRYVSQDGTEYVGLHIDAKRLRMLLDGDREVTAVCQIADAA